MSLILSYWGQTGLGRSYGDLNGNGIVDGPDWVEVGTFWGSGTPPEPPGSLPEPASLGFLLGGALAGLIVTRRCRKQYALVR